MAMRALGRLLRGFRAGEAHLAWNDVVLPARAPVPLALRSAAFADGAPIPQRHAGSGVGDDVSPPLEWTGLPATTRELAIVVEDPSAPIPRPFVHAVVYGIAPSVRAIAEGALSPPAAAGPHEGFAVGKNSLGRRVYMGPRPVPGHGSHDYVFQIFALDRPLGFAKPPSRGELVRAMAGAVVGRGRLVGTYER
jgi:Raf kinase inhibitor-like YbhB/YbcL family protein